MDKLWMDVRYAFRTFAKNPAFALGAILVLALGVGATTAIFSVVNAVLIRPLPYRDPARLVAISTAYRRAGVARTFPTVSLNQVEAWRAQSRTLESIGSFVFTALPATVGPRAMFLVSIGADPELLRTLGVQPQLGRGLIGSGSRQPDPSVLISNRLWKDAFQSDPHVIGRSIVLDGDASVVAGVLPASFQFPRADSSFWPEDPDVILPIANMADGWGRDSTQWFAIGRVKPGVSFAQADSELRAIFAHETSGDPVFRGLYSRIAPLDAETTAAVRPALVLTLGISLVLLLIACSNIMNLLFSRAAQRGHEMALRKAVGATSWRLVRQMLTESACLTFLSGALGVALANLTLDALVAASPAHLPLSGAVVIDWRVLAFALLVCVLASVVAGVLPAIHRSRNDAPLVSGSRTAGNRAVLRFQRVLMVTQIALGVGLLAAGGLLAHSLYRLSSVNAGFRTHDTIGFELAFPSGHPKEAPQLYRRILDATRSVPGVISAGWITNLPPETRAGVFAQFSVVGATSAARTFCNFQVISEDYFKTAGIPIVGGRDITRADSAASLKIAVINVALARQYFRDANPLGRSIIVNHNDPLQIVGIVPDTHDRGLDAKTPPSVYVPYTQFAFAYGAVMARVAGPPEAILPAVQRALAAAAPDVPIKSLATIESRLLKTLDAPRFYAMIAVACALMATLFVTLGLYGVISYGVSRRTAEIGIRVALGASREKIVRGVLLEGLKMSVTGVLLGVGLSLAGTRLLRTLLFEIKPIDPATLAVAAALVIAVTLSASYFPARRASRVEPMVALRCD